MNLFRQDGLERSCAVPARDWIRTAPAQEGLERMEARFGGHAFDRHSHDCYALGLTLSGVQTFAYRGAQAVSRPGLAMVLHPGESHDGQAGTADGFRYRMLYLEPVRIADALRGRLEHLPFAAMPVCGQARLAGVLRAALDDLARPLENLELNDIVTAIAECLLALDGSPGRRGSAADPGAVERARRYLEVHCTRSVEAGELERETGLDRFTLTRQFRNRFATTPHRYQVMRRLDRARRAIRAGDTLADAAIAAGFADQSHFTRHFRRAFGMSPGRWRALSRRA
jgi:AraC-like DNA-binding protein